MVSAAFVAVDLRVYNATTPTSHHRIIYDTLK